MCPGLTALRIEYLKLGPNHKTQMETILRRCDYDTIVTSTFAACAICLYLIVVANMLFRERVCINGEIVRPLCMNMYH